jgi:hypothetical protein
MATNPAGGGARLAPVTLEEAVRGIRSGERVFVGTGAAEPDSLVTAS